MKSRLSVVLAGFATSLGLPVCTVAGDFYNLGFDDPRSITLTTTVYTTPIGNDVTYRYGGPADLVSGWSFSLGGQPYIWSRFPGMVGKVYYSDRWDWFGGPGITLTGTGALGSHSLAIRGADYDYMVQNMVEFPVYLSQTGLVPEGASELRFLHTDGFTHPAAVTMNGVSLSTTSLGAGKYSAEVSAFAGSEAGLMFAFLGDTTSTFDIYGFFDRNGNLTTIPEPSTFALLGLGGVGMGWWLRRRRG